MESDLDSTMLACIASSCPNLESLHIFMCDGSFNRITEDELGRLIGDKRCLTSLKMDGCSNLWEFCSLLSQSLYTSAFRPLLTQVFNCPNLKEISLDFSRQENDSTDLTTMMDGLGRSCPKLKNIHIASLRLSHSVVLSLTASNLRGLRKLSLVLGSEITDASLAAIASRLVAETEDDYIQLALELTSDVEALSNLRMSLRSLMSNSPLCDRSKFILGLESTYWDMWHRYCKSDVPS